MIRSSKVTIKFTNAGKRSQLSEFIDEYRRVVSLFVDLLWEEAKVPSLLPAEMTSKVSTWLSARVLQCAGKQSSGIVRGTREKQKRRLFTIEKLKSEGQLKHARKLQKVFDETKISKPNIQNVEPELDSRFVKVDMDNKTSFDGWVTLTSLGKKLKIQIPFKRSVHFNNMNAWGLLKEGLRISKKNITFMFEIPDTEKKGSGSVLGIDIGQLNVISCSNDHISKPNRHGHDLNTISTILSRRKKDSKGFGRAQSHRKNYVNWSINQLNFDGIKQINIEDIKHLRKNKKSSRKLSHWTYTVIFDKLEKSCEEQGVLVLKKNPTYTSQRCSVCGWTRKSNRKGKLFKCGKCGYTCDSDKNASLTLTLHLPEISRQKRLQQLNRKGFYWLVEGQEHIVPVVQKV